MNWRTLTTDERMEAVEAAITRPDRSDWISLGLFAAGFAALIFAWGCFG